MKMVTIPLLLALTLASSSDWQEPRPATFEPALPSHLELPDGRRLAVVDRRDWASDKADDLATTAPGRQAEFDRLFAASVVRRAARAGIPVSTSKRLLSLAARSSQGPGSPPASSPPAGWQGFSDPPVPGGVGYGVTFNNNAFSWSQSTASYQSMIVPRKPGGDVNTWLYNTTTNRSELGVEAFISYFAQQDFRFKVFDWARYPGAPWQTDLPYNQLGAYISSLQNDDGVTRQEMFCINETFSTGTNQWTNRVSLHNRIDDTIDVVYQFSYTTGNPNENTYQPGDSFGWWGPIFETFQDHDGTNRAIGWHDSWLVQDGTTRNFTTGNTGIRIDDPDLTPPIFRTPNRAWAVGSTSGEPSLTSIEAETGRTKLGQLSGDGTGWLASPIHGAGKMLVGPPFRGVPGGRKNAEFRIRVDNLSGPAGDLILYGIYDLTTKTLVWSDGVQLSDFSTAGYYRPFRRDFTAIAGHDYILGARTLGVHSVTIDKVNLVEN